MSHIYGDYEATLRALDVQSGNPRLAKLEEYGVDHATLMAELKILEKPVIDRDELRHKSIEQIATERHAVVFEQLVVERIKILGTVALFADMSPTDLRRAAEQFEEDERDEGTSVFSQNDTSDDFYVVASGEAHIIFEAGEKARTLSVLTPGRFFGELGAMHRTPRNASVKAKPDKEDMQRLELLKLSGPKFRAMFEGITIDDNLNVREIRAWCAVGNCPLFGGLGEDRLRDCVKRVKVETYAPGAVILHEGASPEAFYVVVEGVVKVTEEDAGHKNGERPLRELGDGDHFGEVPLLAKDSSCGKAVHAVLRVTVARIERSDLVAAYKTEEGRAYLRQRAYFRALDDGGALLEEPDARPVSTQDRASRRSNDSRVTKQRKAARAAFKRLVKSFSESLISQMYKQIVGRPTLVKSYGADVAKSFLSARDRADFGKRVLRAMEALNKKNVLDRTMPELTLVTSVLKQAKAFCRQYVADWPEHAWTDFGHHIRVDRVKKGCAVFDTKAKALRFYVLVRGTAAVLAKSDRDEEPTKTRRRSLETLDPETSKGALWKGELGDFVECSTPGDCLGAESLDALRNGRVPKYRQSCVAVSECIFLSFEASDYREVAANVAEGLETGVETKFALLRQTGLFADAPVDQCYTVAYALEAAKCSRGTLLMNEGHKAPRLSFIVRGGVVVRSAGVAVAELGVGDYFGESGLLDKTNLVRGAVESVSCVSTAATDLFVLEDYACIPQQILKRLERNWRVRASWRRDRVAKQRQTIGAHKKQMPRRVVAEMVAQSPWIA